MVEEQYIPNMDHNPTYQASVTSLEKIINSTKDIDVLTGAGVILIAQTLAALVLEQARTNDYLEEIRDVIKSFKRL